MSNGPPQPSQLESLPSSTGGDCCFSVPINTSWSVTTDETKGRLIFRFKSAASATPPNQPPQGQAAAIKTVTAEPESASLTPALDLQQVLLRILHLLETMPNRQPEPPESMKKALLDKIEAFHRDVDPADAQIASTIIKQGDIAKAARALHMSDSTLRRRVEAWKHRNSHYDRLLDAVRWVKASRRHRIVHLSDTLATTQIDPTSLPDDPDDLDDPDDPDDPDDLDNPDDPPCYPA